MKEKDVGWEVEVQADLHAVQRVMGLIESMTVQGKDAAGVVNVLGFLGVIAGMLSGNLPAVPKNSVACAESVEPDGSITAVESVLKSVDPNAEYLWRTHRYLFNGYTIEASEAESICRDIQGGSYEFTPKPKREMTDTEIRAQISGLGFSMEEENSEKGKTAGRDGDAGSRDGGKRGVNSASAVGRKSRGRVGRKAA